MEGNTNDDSRVSQCNSKKGFKTKPSQAWAPAASHRCSAPSPSTSFQWAIERCRSGAKVLKKVRFGVGHAQSGTNSSLTGLCTERALHCIRVSLRCWQGPMIWHLRKPLESSIRLGSVHSPFSQLMLFELNANSSESDESGFSVGSPPTSWLWLTLTSLTRCILAQRSPGNSFTSLGLKACNMCPPGPKASKSESALSLSIPPFCWRILRCYFPACQVRVSRFYQSCFRLPLLLLLLLLLFSSSGSLGLRPQLGAPDLSGHCRTSTASSRSQRALPNLNR